MSADLLEPFQSGDHLTRADQPAVVPMARNGAGENGAVPPVMATRSHRRAGAGRVVPHSAPVSPEGGGCPLHPGEET